MRFTNIWRFWIYTQSYRKGDASYTDFASPYIQYYHAGLVGYVGSSDNTSGIYEMDSEGCKYNTMSSHKDKGCYGVNTVEGDLSDSQRGSIVSTASDIYNDPDITYCWVDALIYESNPGTYVSVNEIDQLHCDGLVEYCYEWNNQWVWGRTDNGQSSGTSHDDYSASVGTTYYY